MIDTANREGATPIINWLSTEVSPPPYDGAPVAYTAMRGTGFRSRLPPPQNATRALLRRHLLCSSPLSPLPARNISGCCSGAGGLVYVDTSSTDGRSPQRPHRGLVCLALDTLLSGVQVWGLSCAATSPDRFFRDKPLPRGGKIAMESCGRLRISWVLASCGTWCSSGVCRIRRGIRGGLGDNPPESF